MLQNGFLHKNRTSCSRIAGGRGALSINYPLFVHESYLMCSRRLEMIRPGGQASAIPVQSLLPLATWAVLQARMPVARQLSSSATLPGPIRAPDSKTTLILTRAILTRSHAQEQPRHGVGFDFCHAIPKTGAAPIMRGCPHRSPPRDLAVAWKDAVRRYLFPALHHPI